MRYSFNSLHHFGSEICPDIFSPQSFLECLDLQAQKLRVDPRKCQTSSHIPGRRMSTAAPHHERRITLELVGQFVFCRKNRPSRGEWKICHMVIVYGTLGY